MSTCKKYLKRLLKDHGFEHVRTTKHEQWSDGITRITLPTGNGFSTRLQTMIELQIKNAVKKRGA